MDTRYVYITAVSKYEAEILKREIQAIDSDAFVIFQKVQSVEAVSYTHLAGWSGTGRFTDRCCDWRDPGNGVYGSNSDRRCGTS